MTTPAAETPDAPDEFEQEFARLSAERAARDAGTTVEADPLGESKPAAEAAEKPVAEKPAEKPAEAAPQEPSWISVLPAEHQEQARTTWKAAQEAEGFKAKHAELTEKFGRQSAQVAAYERRHQEYLKQQAGAQPAAAKPAAAEASAAAGAAESTDWKKFAEQFPEIAAAMDSRLAEVRDSVKAVTEKIDPLAKDREKQLRDAGAAAISAAHPNWPDAARSPEFKAWFEKQPDSLRQLQFSEAPEDTIMVFDFFKSANPNFQWPGAKADSTSTSKPAAAGGDPGAAAAKAAADAEAARLAAKRAKQLEDAAGPRGRPQSTTTTDAPDDFETAFNYYASKRDRDRAVAR